jgi:RNA polymerase sigma-70 factor (ECF subfamily)
MINSGGRIPAVTLGPRSDAELIARIGDEDGDAFETLFRRYTRLVCRVAADILHDATEAEDVMQEVFLEVYRTARSYDPSRGSVRVWLLQYAYHRTFRRKAALGRRAGYRGESLDAVDVPIDGDRRGLSREECRWVIRAGLAQLPEAQRATLELACFEELSLRDIAERLGASVGSTRHYYYRGLARLRAWARLADGRAKATDRRSAVSRERSGRGCCSASRDDKADVETGRVAQPFGRV